MTRLKVRQDGSGWVITCGCIMSEAIRFRDSRLARRFAFTHRYQCQEFHPRETARKSY